MDRQSELLPCPFCGGEATLEEDPFWTGNPQRQGFCGWCKSCDIGLPFVNIREEAITAWNTRQSSQLSELRKAAEGWRPIETAPEVKGEYFFCRVAWGHEADKCTGDGFRWNNRWFAAATFYNNAPFGECQHEMRQIEVHPTHWAPRPAEPNTALSQYRRES